MLYESISFTDLKINAAVYKNKNKCIILKDCVIDLREYTKHIVDDQNQNLKVYSQNYRVRKYINRNPETNAVWYNENDFNYKLDEYVEDVKNIKIDEEIDELFFCYDYLEWQYSHFLTDVYPKMWYFKELSKSHTSLLFGQIRPIINFAYNCKDKNFSFDNSKLNLRSDFAEDITDIYLKNFNLESKLKGLEKGKVYFIKTLIIPVPFTSQDVLNWPEVQFEMYNILSEYAKSSNFLINKKNFISRKDTLRNGWFNLRYLANEDDVFNFVQPHGYNSVELMELKMIDKIKLYCESESIIQQIGSNCFNILFESPNTKNIILMHPSYRSWTEMLSYISDYKNVKLVCIDTGVKLLGLDEYPDVYKRNPDEPWTFHDFNRLKNVL